MKGRKTLLILAIVFGILSVFGASYIIRTQQVVIKEPVKYEKVVVAAVDIPQKTLITTDMLTLAEIPAAIITDQNFKTTDSLVGAIASDRIFKNESVTKNRIVLPDEKGAAVMSYNVPAGMRAVSLPVNELSGVSGFISEKDRIDLLVTNLKGVETDEPTLKASTLLENIEVLAVGHAKQTAEQLAALPTSIVVLVTPEQAEFLVYSANNGTIQISLRNPSDSDQK